MWTSSMTDPFSFAELSTLYMRTGWGRGGLKLVFLYETSVYEHPGHSRIQGCGCGNGCKGSEGGELDLDIEGTGGVLQQDVDHRWGNCHKGFGEVTHVGSLNISGCGFSLISLGYGRSSLITMVCIIQSICTGQLGCTLHQLWL